MSSTEILSLVFEDSSAILAAPLLSIISPGIVFMAFLTVINTSLEGLGNIKTPFISLIFGNVIKLIVTFQLIGRSSLGILGAPIGTVLSYIVSFMISLTVLIKREKIRIKVFDVIILPMVLSSICGVFYIILKNKFTFAGVVDFIIHLTAFCLFYLLLMLLFAFYEMKKGKILSKYTKIKR